MNRAPNIYTVQQYHQHRFTWSDVVVLVGLATVIYAGVRVALDAPPVVTGPDISLAPEALPYYALLSLRRMALAYMLSLIFSLTYGRAAARSPRAERVLMPALDILQSVPILSFLPVVLLTLSAIMPQAAAVELASVVLIFTSQAWNLTFSWYQALTTIPKELSEAASTFRFNGWLRFRTLELPFAALNLIWNSVMSWSGGWFFLMAAEIFTVGNRDFRLPGLGAYLQEAALQGSTSAILAGLGTLVLVIVALDQLVWRPLLAWGNRYKLEMVTDDTPPTSWFYEVLRGSRLAGWLGRAVFGAGLERLDALLNRGTGAADAQPGTGRPWGRYAVGVIGGLLLIAGIVGAAQMLLTIGLAQWLSIGVGVVATALRVAVALAISLAWTIPVGVLIGTNRRLATLLQPVVQVISSIPATALFPIFVVALLNLPGGLNIAAVLLMLMGTQWYLLFNVIAGASAIPQDLKFTSTLLGLKRWQHWRTLILPALFPYLITGAITASGGAWNASIIAEHISFGGETLSTVGIGATIAQATAAGDYARLLAATLAMVLTVVGINRFVWRRLYRLAEEQYRME